MPFKDKEKLKEYQKQYREKRLENYQKNKEKTKEYYQKNKEKIIERQKEYFQTEAGKKTHRIAQWKYTGLKHDNYDELYEYYGPFSPNRTL